ncbi:MAG: NUDIX domain-containing protein [Parcubacteria group bacterium]|jgi:8-oxo-dGTP diphosphatase
MKKEPKVGFGVYILKENRVLFGKRKNSHGEGTWCATGGHLEFGESFEEGAKRETMEEAGIEIKNIRVAGITNDFFEKENKHYVTVALVADYASGEVKMMEPDKWVEWDWFSWDNLPNSLFLTTEHLLEQGFNPFEK